MNQHVQPRALTPDTTPPSVEYRQKINEARKLLEEAGAIRGVPDTWRAQAWAASALVAEPVHMFATNCGDMADAEAINDDLRRIADAVDPLIETIGREARGIFPISSRFDIKAFQSVVWAALDGNATYEIEAAGERSQERE